MKHTHILLTLLVLFIIGYTDASGKSSRSDRRYTRRYRQHYRQPREEDPVVFAGVGVRTTESGNAMVAANLLLGGPIGGHLCLGGNAGIYAGNILNNAPYNVPGANYYIHSYALGANVSTIIASGRSSQLAFHILIDPELSILYTETDNGNTRTSQSAGHINIKPALTYANADVPGLNLVTLGVFYNYNLVLNPDEAQLTPALQAQALNGVEVTALVCPFARSGYHHYHYSSFRMR